MGEILAKNELFIFSTTMLQRLQFSYEGDIPELDVHMGITRKIHQQMKIIIKSI